MNKVLAFAAAAVMSIAFITESWTRELLWLDYIGYSFGMAFSYAPVAVAKALKSLRPGMSYQGPVRQPTTVVSGQEES